MEIIAKSVNRENFNYTTHIIHKDFRGKIVELGNRFILTCSSRNLPFYPNLLGISNSNTVARGKSIVSDSSHRLSTYMAKGIPVPANRSKTGIEPAHRMSMQTGSSALHKLLKKA